MSFIKTSKIMVGNKLILDKKFLFILFAGLFFFNVKAQNLDSLENMLRNGKISVNEKIKLFEELSWEYLSTDIDKSKQFAKQGVSLAAQQKDETMEAKLYQRLGVAYYMKSQMDTAQIYLNKALEKALKVKDKKIEATVYVSTGNIYNVQGEYQKCIQQYLKALPIFEKLNEKERIQAIYGNLGAVFMGLKNLDEAEKNYRKSEKINKELDNASGLGQSYDGLSRIFLERNIIDSALVYGQQAVKQFEKTGNLYNHSIALNTIAMIYYSNLKDYSMAKRHSLKSYAIAKEMGIPGVIAGSLNTLSNISFYEKNYKQCVAYATEALKTDTTDVNILTNIYTNLTRGNIWLGNKQQANNYLDKYRLLIDKRASEEYQQSLSEMQTKYETEEKDIKISSMQKQGQFYGTMLVSAILGLLLLTVILLLRQKNIKAKKQLAEQKVVQLEQEKQLVATQALLDGETAERTRLARDLHDGLGGMLSAIKLNLNDVKKGIHLDENDIIRFNQALEMLETSKKELRRVAHNMMPEALSRYGLKTSLQDFVRNISKAKFHYFGDDTRLDPKLEVMVYRTAYELINNALKHAEAKTINIELVQQPDSVSLTVQDDGKGFNPEIIKDVNGLQNIKSRVESFNGTMNIISLPGEGTEINVDFKTGKEI